MEKQLTRHLLLPPPGDYSLERDVHYLGQLESMYGEMTADITEILDHITNKILLINKTW